MNARDHTIFIVEDEPDEAILLRQAFQKAQLRNPIQLFRDGQAVIDYLSKRGTDSRNPFSDAVPTLMLLDLKMPRKTGFEVLEWLRHQSQLKRLVVIVMANSLHPSDVNRAYELGCNSYLAKPTTPEQFVELVTMIFKYWLVLNINPDLDYTSNPMVSSLAGQGLIQPGRPAHEDRRA